MQYDKNIPRPHLDSELIYYSDKTIALELSDDIQHLRQIHKLNSLSNDWMSSYFSHQELNLHNTPIKGISAVPVKSCLSSSADQATTFNQLPRFVELHDTDKWSTSDWEAKWKNALAASVRSSVEGHKQVALMLSSGIDSAGLAAHLSQMPDIKLKAFSWRFPNHPDADESQAISQIVDYLKIDHEFIDIKDAKCFSDLDSWKMSHHSPYFNAMRRIKAELYKRVADQGYEVLLNGHLGDELAWVDRQYYTELISDQPRRAITEIVQKMAEQGISIRYDASIRYLVKRMINQPDKPLIYDYLTQGCQSKLLELAGALEVNEFRHEQYANLLSDSTLNAIATESFYTAEFGIKRKHPYLNEGLISLALACPAYLLSTPTHTKYLARKALNGMLPENIIWQDRVGKLDSIFEEGLTLNEGYISEYLFQENRIWPNYIQEEVVLDVMKNRKWKKAAGVLSPCIGLERWLNVWREKEMPLQFEPFTD